MFYLSNTPLWLRLIFPPGVVWTGDRAGNTVYLTFDDGPDPAATPYVLEELRKYQMKATFFCVGANVAKYPELFQQLKQEGHRVGNHTMNHKNGWKTSDDSYVQEIIEADKLINSNLFRPPYGKITRSQLKLLREQTQLVSQSRIIMWGALAGDFDAGIDGKKCFDNVRKNTSAGSIIVFHDSQKALPRLKEALPATLDWLSKKGFSTGLI
jgi:peptidoglycan/xylan/chitin deacetylase (PgdA/CDA1 family)